MSASPDRLRRAVLAGLGLAALGWVLRPARPRHRRPVPRGRVEVLYWEKWTGAEGAALQRCVDRFNAEQDRIHVTRLPVADLVVKALVATAGGDPPDVVGLFDANLPQFAESGALLDLDALPGPRVVEPERYAPPVARLLAHEGRVRAAVATCHTMALYYDAARLRERGMPPPKTTDALADAAVALAERDARGGLARVGFLPNVPFWWPYLWPALFGGELFDEAAGRCTLTDDACVAAYRWIASFPDRLGRDAVRSFGAGFARAFLAPQDPFFVGRVTMTVQGPWLAAFARRFAPSLELGCTALPEPEGAADPARPAGVLEADVLAIPRGARRAEEAAEFLRFMQRRDVLEELASAHAKPSPLRAVTSEFVVGHPNPFVGLHAAIAASPRVRTAPRLRTWPQYAAMIGSAFDAIWGGADVLPQLADVERRAQALVDRAAERRRERRRQGLLR